MYLISILDEGLRIEYKRSHCCKQRGEDENEDCSIYLLYNKFYTLIETVMVLTLPLGVQREWRNRFPDRSSLEALYRLRRKLSDAVSGTNHNDFPKLYLPSLEYTLNSLI